MRGLLLQAVITDPLAQKMSNEENQLILHSAIRLMWNMVPDDGVKSAEQLQENMMKSANFL